MDWNKETFSKSRKEKKPILLDLTAVWCHWCHRQDKDTYENTEIIKIVNEKFVPIRVDIDKRPDIRERYHFGGFPTTALLTSDGRVITGGTYIPPNQLKPILLEIAEDFKKSKGKIDTQFSPFERRVDFLSAPSRMEHEITENITEKILSSATENFDFDFGGFGNPQKFPTPAVLELAMLEYRKTGDVRFLKMVDSTLEGMENLLDKIGDGFFRYSTSPDWKSPHYEKMLETNAGMIENYLDGYALTKKEKYKEIAEKTIEYVKKVLYDRQKGAFYGSQDADEEYYKLNEAERRKRKTPSVDKTFYTDLNAMMVSAFLKASVVLDNKGLREIGLKAIEFLLKNSVSDMAGHYFDGKQNLGGLLSDQVYLIKCLLDAYEITHDKKYLKESESLTKIVLDKFYDKELGGFFDRLKDESEVGNLNIPFKPIFENSVMAGNLLRLYHLTENEDYKKEAKATLLVLLDNYESYGFMASHYGLAVEKFLTPVVIDIIGESGNSKDILDASLKIFEPRKIVKFLDASKDKKTIKEKGYQYRGKPYAQVCKGVVCLPAKFDGTSLTEQLSEKD